MLRDLCGQRRTHRRHLASEVSTAESGFLHRHQGVRERASIIAWNLESRSNTRQLQNGESRSRAYKQKLSEVKTIINDATSEVEYYNPTEIILKDYSWRRLREWDRERRIYTEALSLAQGMPSCAETKATEKAFNVDSVVSPRRLGQMAALQVQIGLRREVAER